MTDISKAFQTLIFDMYYRYRNYKGLKQSDGTVLVGSKIYTIEEFHQWVDDFYETIDKSVEKAFNNIKS